MQNEIPDSFVLNNNLSMPYNMPLMGSTQTFSKKIVDKIKSFNDNTKLPIKTW